jgi:hypothetical protein
MSMSSKERQKSQHAESVTLARHAESQRPGPSHGAARILELQKLAGNRAVEQLLHTHSAKPSPVPDGDGRPLTSRMRSYFEQRFGTTFGKVRVHAGERAAQSAEALHAAAYTVGNDVVFGAGGFNPQSKQGQNLLAHELAHVVQQSRGGNPAATFDTDSSHEHAAHAAAHVVAAGGTASVQHGAASGSVQRQESDVPDVAERDIVYQISEIQRPLSVATFWDVQVKPQRAEWSQPLSELEQGYIQAFRDPSTPKEIQMRVPVDPANLTAEERAEAERLFGAGPAAAAQYANYENRRRILAHYVYTHPATVRAELGLYRLFRDVNPIHFALERGWQIGSGQEMFTGQEVSRLGAAGEFLLYLAVAYGVGKALGAARPTPQFEVPSGPPRPLTAPIYDLPPEGGGIRVGGRWYTEHALERMAPDTPEVRAELRTRTAGRLERLGIKPDNPAYSKVLGKALGRIDPRGVPPSVVEAEIANPGSTNVRVITARRGQVVVTVMPR